jgi:hypothetical protein
MASSHANLGGRLQDDVQVFRAFAQKSYRSRKKNQVRYFAFLLREDDIYDGLSLGLSPEAAVQHLQINEGYCLISVGAIHSLPYGLEVRSDLTDQHHAYLCNLPLMAISDDTREQAILIGGELARKARVVTCDPFIPPVPNHVAV